MTRMTAIFLSTLLFGTILVGSVQAQKSDNKTSDNWYDRDRAYCCLFGCAGKLCECPRHCPRGRNRHYRRPRLRLRAFQKPRLPA